MNSLEGELERARELSVGELADAIEAIGFECTRCGACCKSNSCGSGGGADSTGEHTATIFPEEIRRLQEHGDYDWRDVARPMPYGLVSGDSGQTGTTFEWALRTDSCGDCVFYDEAGSACSVYDARPLICRTYPFSIALGGTSQPMGEAVDREGIVRAHECEGIGREIDRDDARRLAETLKERAIRELEEAIAVRDNYEPRERTDDGIVVYDSEGAKREDGTPR